MSSRRATLATNLGGQTPFRWAWEGYGILDKFINQDKEYTLWHTEKSMLPFPPEIKCLWASEEWHYFHSDAFVLRLSFQFTHSVSPLKQLPVFLKITWCHPTPRAMKTAAMPLELSCQLSKEQFYFKAKQIQRNQELFSQMSYVFEAFFSQLMHFHSLKVLLGLRFVLCSCFCKWTVFREFIGNITQSSLPPVTLQNRLINHAIAPMVALLLPWPEAAGGETCLRGWVAAWGHPARCLQALQCFSWDHHFGTLGIPSEPFKNFVC